MVSGQDIVNEAKNHLNKPYKYGAAGPNSFDCSGLVVYVFGKFGISLPHGTKYLIGKGSKVGSKGELRAGDLIFPHSGHVGIAMGDGNMIHAPHTGDVVRIAPIKKFYAGRRIV